LAALGCRYAFRIANARREISSVPNDAEPEQALAWLLRRWQVNLTDDGAHARLDTGTQRQHADRAIAWTTLVILAM